MSKRMRFVVVAWIMIMLILPLDVLAKAWTFTDVTTESRAYDEIKYVVDQNIMNGRSQTKFDPDAYVTRAEAAAVIGRSLKLPNTKNDTGFKDVPASHHFSGYISEMVERNILAGYPDGTFRPNEQLTRGQMAMIIGRAYFDQFSGSVSASASDLMRNGIAQGIADGTFGERLKIKRSDFAVFVARTVEPSFRLSVVQPPTPQPEQKPEVDPYVRTMYVTSEHSDLNVRTGRGVQYPSIMKLPFQTKVEAAYPVAGWIKIRVNGVEGYVSEAYLSTTYPQPTPKPSPGMSKPELTGANKYLIYPEGQSAPLFASANSSSKVLTRIPTGSQVRVLSSGASFTQVQYGNTKGYVRSNLLFNVFPTTPAKPTTLANEVIIIDPGHGGTDPGAIGHGYNEATATLAIAKYAKNYFDNSPFQLKMTRETNTSMSLAQRVDFAHRHNGSLFISIHINSFSNSSANGMETYYYSPRNTTRDKEARAIASYMQNRAQKAWRLNDRKVKTAPFLVIRFTGMPSTLLEAGFITNKSDNAKIRSAAWQEKMGRAVYLSTLDYYYHEHGMVSETLPLYEAIGEKPSKRIH
ncbi:N-acetylmuramoyl-L-alanine amidase [Savagea faecisuis]|uniref:N-acetylmuramoyl-L-alanine amidase n=1 Tax=Savagea faecisuis TaxID=1274803 RepID=A0ABW3GVP0_9BACL